MPIEKTSRIFAATLFLLLLTVVSQRLNAQAEEMPAEIRAKYFHVNRFHEGRAAFHGKDCLWGYLDEDYQEIIPARFDHAASFSSGIAKVNLKRGEAFIDESGNLLNLVAREVRSISIGNYSILQSKAPDMAVLYDVVNKERLTEVNTYNQIVAITDDLFVYKIGVRFGLMNNKGEAITPARYHQLFKVINLRENSSSKKKPPYYQVRIEGNYGVIDSLGQEIIPLQYKNVMLLDHYPLFAVQDPKTKFWGILNAQHKIVLPFRYSKTSINLMVISEDLICILEEDNMVAYNHIGLRLKVYDENAEIFSVADAIVLSQDGYRYLLGSQGQVISDTYFDIDPFGDSLLMVQIENKHGLCDRTGKVILPVNYSSIIEYRKLIYFARKGADIQLLQKDGSLLLPDIYQEANWLNDSLLVLKRPGFKGLYNILQQKWYYSGDWTSHRLLGKTTSLAIKRDSVWQLISLSDPDFRVVCDSFYETDSWMENYSKSINGLFIIKHGAYFEVDNTLKKISAPIEYPPSEKYIYGEETYYIIRKKENKYNVLRKSDNKEIFKTDYSIILAENKGLFVIENEENIRAVMNLEGDTIIPFIYPNINVKNNIITAESYIDNRIIYFGANYKEIELPKDHFWANNVSADYGLLLIKKGSLMGCINQNGEIILPAEFEHIAFHRGGIIEAKKGLFYDYYNLQGEWIECYRRKSPRF